MSGMYLAIFVLAFGFITAAIITNMVSAIFSEDGKIYISFSSVQNWVLGILFFMFSGPYLVATNGVELWWRGEIQIGFVGFCILTSALWSFCLGILMVSLLSITGLIPL